MGVAVKYDIWLLEIYGWSPEYGLYLVDGWMYIDDNYV